MAEKGWPIASLFKGFRPEHCQKPISNSLCFSSLSINQWRRIISPYREMLPFK